MKHNQTLRRGLGILLSLVMCLSLLPATALAAETETANFASNAARAVELLGGIDKAEWDSTSKTLTLKGVNFTTSAAKAVILPEGATIVLEGKNTIAGGSVTDDKSCGIYANGDLTIKGSGSLTVRGGGAQYSNGIYAQSGNVSIEGGTVEIIGGTATNKITCSSYGIYAQSGSVSISGGTTAVTVRGGTAISDESNSTSCGIRATKVTISGGSVKATGGTATTTDPSYACGSYGIYAGSVTLEGGSTEATGDAATNISYGIYARNTVTISNDATAVTAKGGSVTNAGADQGSYGIYAQSGSVTISGGSVKATGSYAEGKNGYSYGIFAGTSVTISGGHVTIQTLGGENIARALNPGPSLNYTDYYWRTGTEVSFMCSTGEAAENYIYDRGHTYVEFSNGYTYTITLDPNYEGGESGTVVTGTDGKLSELPTATRSGYTFDGWYTAASDGEKVNKDKVYDKNATLYAHWTEGGTTPTTYTVTFNANGGAGEMGRKTTTGEYTLPECTFTAPVGKQFAGWATSADGEVIAVTTITVTADTTLYAIWEDIPVAKTYTVTAYGLYGITLGITPGETYTRDYAAGQPVDLQIGIHDGYNLKEVQVDGIGESDYTWTAGQNVEVNDRGISFTMPGHDVIVTIVWEKKDTESATKTITLNATGGYVECTSIETGEDGKLSPLPTPTRSGYTFDGWYTEGGTTAVTTETVFDQDTILYARWTEGVTPPAETTYTVTFDPNGGSVTSASAQTGTDGKLSTLPTPTREGYTFDGWYTAASGGEKVDVNKVYTENTTLYAHWTANSSGDGDSSGGGSSTPTYAPTVTQPENGAVTVSPKAPKQGDTVTITPKPDSGYTVEQILVTDKNGKPVAVTSNGDGTFSFTQPEGAVTVTVTFMEDNSMLNFFVDVFPGDYYYDAVLWAVENGITSGTTATTFSPDASCTRAQMVTFLWRAAGSPKASGSNPFSDVSADAYYYDAVLWAVKNGITSGTSATTFSPDATCTRAQSVTFLWRTAGSPAASGSSFSDVSSDAYYANAVAWAVKNSITLGTSDTTFSPNADCTRAQIVTFLYRAMGE